MKYIGARIIPLKSAILVAKFKTSFLFCVQFMYK